MSSFYDDASLVVIPSGYKTSKVYAEKPTDGSGDLAFTRTGDTATRVNSAGLIEKVRTNLLLQSNTFSNAAWLKQDISLTSGQIGYDGTTNAWKLTPNTSNFAHYTYQNIVTTGLLTFSVYAKPDGYNFILLYTGGYGGTFFDISTGTIGGNLGSAPSATKIEAAGNGFYRCSITVPSSADVAVFAANTISNYIFAGNGTSGVLIQSAQYETGDIATAYIPTTTAAVSVGPVANVPRLDYTGSTCPRLLLEPQRTNLATYSEQFTNAAWLKINTTATANVVTSPDGYTNADKIIPANGNNIAVVYQSIIPAGTSTASIYAKAGEFGGIVIATGTTGAFFNLTTGQYRTAYNAAPTAYSITSVGNGWYRCSVTLTSAADNLYIGANDNVSNDLTVTGNGTSGIYIWGAQVEAGAYATSYIPTLGAAVTRGAEECSKTGISSLIGQTAGSVFVESYVGSGPASMPFWLRKLSGGLYGDLITVQTINNIPQFEVYTGGVSIVYIVGSTPLSNGFHKFAVAYANNDFVFYVDGVQIGTDTSGTPPTCDELYIDQYIDGGNRNATKKQVMLFKTRLPNSSLAELTSL